MLGPTFIPPVQNTTVRIDAHVGLRYASARLAGSRQHKNGAVFPVCFCAMGKGKASFASQAIDGQLLDDKSAVPGH